MVPSQGGDGQVTETTETRPRALQEFLRSIEKRAFRIAQIQLRHQDDALDAVQDAMLQLARRYGLRPGAEWRPLFYRILENRIRDTQRRRKVRARVMAWLPSRTDAGGSADDGETALVEHLPDRRAGPEDLVDLDQAMATLESELRQLPRRQRQAFLLRNFEGMDVAETAQAMGCSAGSVKTHYFRAVHTLRDRLRDFQT